MEIEGNYPKKNGKEQKICHLALAYSDLIIYSAQDKLELMKYGPLNGMVEIICLVHLLLGKQIKKGLNS